MPLTPPQRKEFRRVALENMAMWDSPIWFSNQFPISRAGARKIILKLKEEFPEWNEKQAIKEVSEVTNGLRGKLEGDIETGRRYSLKQLKEATDRGDQKLMLAWWDRLMANAKLRAEMGRALNILIDARDQRDQSSHTTHIGADDIQARLNEAGLCGECECCKRLFASMAKEV